MINKSAGELFGHSEAAAVGKAISTLIANDALNTFITDTESDTLEREQEFTDINGQSYQARVILIEGGSRYVRLRRL
jgi:hypothetical protein